MSPPPLKGTAMKFDCTRTCKLGHWCRFSLLLRAIGPTRVNSHTATVKVSIDPDTLSALVAELGGIALGVREHHLGFGNYATGHGWKIPSWVYGNLPCQLVLREGGSLIYDNANTDVVKALEAKFAIAKAETEARNLGWQTERTEAGLVVHHPAGGSITITAGGVVDAAGFVGRSCHEAVAALGVNVGDVVEKPEVTHTQQRVQEG